MTRYTFLSILITIMQVFISCEHEVNLITSSTEDMYKIEFNLVIDSVPYSMTKAENTNLDETDDFIDRVDMYEYNKSGELLRHEVWNDPDGLEISAIKPICYGIYQSRHNLVFIANLDEDSANYLATLSADEIGEMPTGIIPLEANNFRLHKPIMCGCKYAYFNSNQTKTVTLYRYLTRIEISNIIADFDDTSLFNKDVLLKRIAIINYPNALRLLDESANKIVGVEQDVLGSGFTIATGSPAFGNLKRIENGCNNWELNALFFDAGKGEGVINLKEFGGKGKLDVTYNYILNNNRLASKGELIIDAKGDQLTASVHEFDINEGRLCSSTNAGISHSISINKVFYTIPVKRSNYASLYGELATQDDIQKLVLEVEIDGTKYFYIISMKDLNAGMIYKITNINLKGIGSAYSNKYAQQYDVKSVNKDECYTIENFETYGY